MATLSNSIPPLAVFARRIFDRLGSQELPYEPPANVEAFTNSAKDDPISRRHPLCVRLWESETELIEDQLFARPPHNKKANVARAWFEDRRKLLHERAAVIVSASQHFQKRIPALNLSKRVQLFSGKLLRRGSRESIGGKSADDFAFDAILETLEYRRKWRRPNRVSLFQHLCGCVKSSYFNDLDRELLSEPMEHAERSSGNEDGAGGVVIPDRQPSPEQAYTARQARALLLAFIGERDEQLVKFAEAALDLVEFDSARFPNQELAQALGVNVKDVENMRKRLRRALTDFRLQYEV